MHDLRVIVTGGTFDKVYDPIAETLTFEDTHVIEMLKRGRVNFSYIIEMLMLIDSLYMTLDDRQTIRKRCTESIENRILLTHGTGTLVETAEVLGKSIEDKTIVIVGAMIPYTVKYSDALFNFGLGIGAAMSLPPGVYVGMNGLAIPWHNVIKNTETGVFEAKWGSEFLPER